MATNLNITRRRGDTKRFTLTIKDEAGVIVDVSGWTGFGMAINTEKAPVDTSTEIALFTGTFSTDGVDGRVYFAPTGTEDVGKYHYDVQAIDTNGEKDTFLYGKYTVVQDINKV